MDYTPGTLTTLPGTCPAVIVLQPGEKCPSIEVTKTPGTRATHVVVILTQYLTQLQKQAGGPGRHTLLVLQDTVCTHQLVLAPLIEGDTPRSVHTCSHSGT